MWHICQMKYENREHKFVWNAIHTEQKSLIVKQNILRVKEKKLSMSLRHFRNSISEAQAGRRKKNWIAGSSSRHRHFKKSMSSKWEMGNGKYSSWYRFDIPFDSVVDFEFRVSSHLAHVIFNKYQYHVERNFIIWIGTHFFGEGEGCSGWQAKRQHKMPIISINTQHNGSANNK